MRVFKFLTGKLTRVFDESLQTFSELQQMRQQLPDMEFGRRMAAERDLQKSDAFSLANIGECQVFRSYPRSAERAKFGFASRGYQLKNDSSP